MQTTIAAAPTRGKSHGDPLFTCESAHPFAAADIAHALRWRFGEYLQAPPRLKSLLQRHFLELLAREAKTWRPDSVLEYAASKARALERTAALVAKIERAAALVALDATESDIRAEAARRAELMRMESMCRPPGDRAAVRAHLAASCRALGVEPPADDPAHAAAVRTGPAIARMICPLWWRRRLRGQHVLALGAAYRELGRVSAGRELYAADATVRRRREQLEANAAAAAACVLESETGRRITRAQAIASSVSNPQVRAAELMTRINGVEAWASAEGFIAAFVTLTAPARMHRRTQTDDGRAIFDNPTFDPAWASPRRIHRDYFAPLWRCIRSKLARRRLVVFGTRSAEPHHDGTPHWHLMLFCKAEQFDQVHEIVRGYALADSPAEPGAQKHRCTIKRIPAGFITSYLAKYVLELARAEDQVGAAIAAASASDPTRCAAWAWENRIRQFQFFGVPEVGVWRELRRVALEVRGMPNPHLVDAPQVLRDAALAVQRITHVDVDTGEVLVLKPADFGAYIYAQGGCGGKRADRPLSVARVEAAQLTRYGETYREPIGVLVIAPRIRFDAAGELVCEPGEQLLQSERERWRVVEFRAPAVAERAARARPWARVNNCTGAAELQSDGNERGPPLWAPLGPAPDLSAVPVDRLDRELQRAIEAAQGQLVSTWYWPRSGVPSRRPQTPEQLEEAADLARDLARLGPIPA